MIPLIKYVCGIDIAKDKFDACLMSVDVQLTYRVKASRLFSNNEKGFKEFLAWITRYNSEKAPFFAAMEASGVYHESLAIWLTEKNQSVSVILPNKARKYMQALGLKSKNDTIDARGLAQMGAQHTFPLWKPIAKFYYELRLLTRHYQCLQESKTMEANRLHALEHSGHASKEVSKQQRKILAFYEKQVAETRKHITDKIHSDETVKRKVNQICRIKGIDILSVATVLAETNGFELFTNAGQLISYAGYDVVENQSGNHTGRTRISKKGNNHIRRILHMPALNVVRWKEPAFLQLYDRVYGNTKIKMKAYVAVQKKLLSLIYALWKKDSMYDPDYVISTSKTKGTTSGNDELRASFPLHSEEKILIDPEKVVLPSGSTTQDRLRYNESPEAFFPLL